MGEEEASKARSWKKEQGKSGEDRWMMIKEARRRGENR